MEEERSAHSIFRRFHAHTLVLTSASKYFEARIENAMEGGGGGLALHCEASSTKRLRLDDSHPDAGKHLILPQASGGRQTLAIPVEGKEMDAAEVLLGCM